MEQVTVIGAGAMGRQIALQCALRGLPVVLHDSGGNALAKATAFDIFDGRFYPYQEIREGDVTASVYVRWDAVVKDWAFAERLRARPELHAAIMAMLKEPS